MRLLCGLSARLFGRPVPPFPLARVGWTVPNQPQKAAKMLGFTRPSPNYTPVSNRVLQAYQTMISPPAETGPPAGTGPLADTSALLATGMECEVWLRQAANGRLVVSRRPSTSIFADVKPEKEFEQVGNLWKEVSFHPNIARCVEATSYEHVIEYVPHSLSQGIEKFGPDRINLWQGQLRRAVNFLHDQGISYSDLKLDHLRVDKNGDLKLIDLGDIRVMPSKEVQACLKQERVQVRALCRELGQLISASDRG